MAATVQINPRYEQLVRSHGLADFRAVMSRPVGISAGSHASRDVQLIRIEDGGQAIELYLKREWQTYLKDRIWGLLAGFGWSAKAKREWQVLQALARRGIACPEPVVMAQQGRLRPRAYLVTRGLAAAVDLHRFLSQQCGRPNVAGRRRFAARLGQAVARLHQAGVDHPDLFAKHVFVCAEGSSGVPVGGQRPEHRAGRWQGDGADGPALSVAFIDLQRSRLPGRVSPRRRYRDLASLDASLSPELASETDRLAFLLAYLSSAGRAGQLRAAATAIRRRSRRLLRRRKIVEMRRSGTAPSGQFVRVGDGRLHVRADWIALLRAAGLDDFERLMNGSCGQLVRRPADRDDVLLELPAADGGTVRAYLKRHRCWHPVRWAWQRLTGRLAPLPGRYEAEQIRRLQRAGLRTMELIAFGERWGRWGKGESVVVTREVPNARPLDRVLREQFQDRSAAGRRRLRLIDQVAVVARRFHQAGYNHRSFCCSHLLVRAADRDSCGQWRPDGFELYLVGLERVRYRRRFRRRWIVKDLAQLDCSARGLVSRSDRLRFLKRYLNVRRLGPAERRLIARVLAESARVASHAQHLT